MSNFHRREFLRQTARFLGGAAAAAMFPASICRALAIPAAVQTGTVQDVKHVVIVMQENRSFDHYFGTLRGVRGFGDPHPIPLPSGKDVWFQSDGMSEIPPYHLNPATSRALLVPETPHRFADAQAAWNQGILDQWPRFKTGYSMGYYRRQDIPFQYALADAFTLCDSYHCSVTTGTDPNRVAFFSGSNFDPALRAQGINSGPQNAEGNNLRCLVAGALPSPGYSYQGGALTWLTLPDLLQAAGVSWRIYQDPNNNWNGLMHGGLAFKSFRRATAVSGSPLFTHGMSLYSIAQLQQDAANGTLPQVAWILPTPAESEHPGASNPDAGAYFISQIIDALAADPAVWSKTALFVTFDENDGLFDHISPPAVPSYDAQGRLAGGSTLPLAGEYFDGSTGGQLDANPLTGSLRPWGMGPRVPMFVVSPWSRGGWVNSQVFDHTSIGMFLEKRFGIHVSSISPWHRAISGDLSSTFDFSAPNDPSLPQLPDMSNYAAIISAQQKLPPPTPPTVAQTRFQEPGLRLSRALPYVLYTTAGISPTTVTLTFKNAGAQGTVFHVYDKLHLDRIPRRYTVESGKSLSDAWSTTADGGSYDLRVQGPNGFLRSFTGNASDWSASSFRPEILVDFEPAQSRLALSIQNAGELAGTVELTPSNPLSGIGTQNVFVPAGGTAVVTPMLASTGNWYDFTVSAPAFQRGFAGRMETGKSGFSDPAMAMNL